MSTRGTIETFIRDKLGITAIIVLLVYDAMQDVSTVHLILRLFALVALAGYTLYENHRHVEKIGAVDKFRDLIRELKDQVNKETTRLEKVEPVPVEDSDIEDNPVVNYLIKMFADLVGAESKVEEPKVEEEPVQDDSEAPVDG